MDSFDRFEKVRKICPWRMGEKCSVVPEPKEKIPDNMATMVFSSFEVSNSCTMATCGVYSGCLQIIIGLLEKKEGD